VPYSPHGKDDHARRQDRRKSIQSKPNCAARSTLSSTHASPTSKIECSAQSAPGAPTLLLLTLLCDSLRATTTSGIVRRLHDAASQAELLMPRSRLKIDAKAVPAAKRRKPPPPLETGDSQQSSPPPPKESEFSAGDSVSHPKFGNGTVTAIDGDKLTIEFTGKVTKQIVDYYVKRRAR
jgi:hypothetical protein